MRGSRRCRAVALVAALPFLSGPALGKVIQFQSPADNGVQVIEMTGDIASRDVSDLRALILAGLKQWHARQVTIWLNSPGGDVDAAMGMGEILREHAAVVTVADRCYSACVLVLAAGVVRLPRDGTVGIHRPRFDDAYFAGLSPAEAQRVYDERADKVRAYLARMGLPDTLFHAMMAVASDDLRVLSHLEMDRFDLFGETPAYAEWLRSRQPVTPPPLTPGLPSHNWQPVNPPLDYSGLKPLPPAD